MARPLPMKGVILAGGLGTRLRPLTLVTNKHLLPVYDRPMIHYPIQCLLNAGIDDILLVTGGEHAGDFVKLLKDGRHLGIRHLEYAYQEGQGGIADALMLAEAFADRGRICVVLGDNLIQTNLRRDAQAFATQTSGARLILKRVDDPHRFGVARFEGDRLVDIVEKPADPPTDLAVTGFYFYDRDVFDFCRAIGPADNGELEITDVNRRYVQRGDVTWSELAGWWTDAGTFASLHRASNLVAEGGANQLDLVAAPITESPAS